MSKLNSNTISHHFRQQIDVHTALKERNKKTNVWFCDSPKNGKRLIIKGDIAFCALKLAEGDKDIVYFEVDPLCAIEIYGLDYAQNNSTARVKYRNGKESLWAFYWSTSPHKEILKAHQARRIQEHAESPELEFRTFTEKDFVGREIELDNWLLLTAAINRSQAYPTYQEEQICKSKTESSGSIALRELLNDQPEIDPALMLASIAKLLQQGVLIAELKKELFGLSTELRSAL